MFYLMRLRKTEEYLGLCLHKMDKDHEEGEVFTAMKERKLKYTIHNPNSVDDTIRVLLQVFVEANAGKVERKIAELTQSEEKGNKQELQNEDNVGV